jgi:hypothetical protein
VFSSLDNNYAFIQGGCNAQVVVRNLITPLPIAYHAHNAQVVVGSLICFLCINYHAHNA